MRRFLLIATAVILLLVMVVGLTFYGRLHSEYGGWDGDSTIVVLPSGEPAGRLLTRLHEAGVLAETWPLKSWLALRGGAEQIRAGEYLFERSASALTVLARLQSGDVMLHSVTIPEGRTLAEIVMDVTAAGFSETEALQAVFADPALVAELDPLAEDLEGYLFPDTYHFPGTVTAETVALTMVRRFQEVANEEFLAAAGERGLGLREAVTLASLIEKESGLSTERPRISRVFHNRLERGMPLQCDPTVLYAWARRGQPVERLTRKHLELDSPWNTYVYPGLPVGPIANPGAESLRAAIAPSDGNELYFVASPDGGHTFNASYEGHRRAVRTWRRYLRSSSR